ncbi:MAG TPA: tetratricopeptide repeat-containing glycosyltransferase family protein [Tepidisphaeraceae bacterium]|jgi:tetratricopeptide (TPR) repeat protein
MGEMTFDQAFSQAHDHYINGRSKEAEAILLQILAVFPDQPETVQLAGIVMHNMGRGSAGIEMIRRAIDLQPNSAPFHSNLGVMLANLPETEGALAAFRKAIELDPALADAHNNIGNLLKMTDRRDESIEAYRKALALRPDYPEAHNNLGAALEEKGELDEALVELHQAIKLVPTYPEALNNLGNVYQDMGRLDEAFDAYNRSLAARPANPDARTNRGNAFRAIQKLDEALVDYRAALELRPQYPEALWGVAFARLIQGNFEEGWRTLESRWSLKDRPLFWHFTEPMWDGTDPTGKIIALFSEQGLGDTIQFIRYASMVAARGAQVMLLCQPELKRLLTGQLGIQYVTSDGQNRPLAAAQCPLMSLPRIFGTTLSNVPAPVPYLNPDPKLASNWRQRMLGTPGGLKVGLAWAGSPAHRNDRNRSIPLAMLTGLAQIPNVTLFSLQKNRPARDAGTSIEKMIDWTDEFTDMADTAALVSNLDLVVSVDSAVAHLAGALGKRTCTLLPHAPDWRWLLNRTDSPWYPTMRLVRQPAANDWQTPIRQLTEQITHLAGRAGNM